MRLDIHSKTFSLLGRVECTATDGVPRIGEYIATPADYLEDAGRIPQLLVVNVRYVLHDGALIAEVEAMAQGDEPDTRRDRLIENGWL